MENASKLALDEHHQPGYKNIKMILHDNKEISKDKNDNL